MKKMMMTIDNKNKWIKIHRLGLKENIFITEAIGRLMMAMMVMLIILTGKKS